MSVVTEVILERINTLVVVINTRGKIEYVSPSAQRILGYKPDELLGDGWYRLTRNTRKEREELRRFVSEQLSKPALTETRPIERKLVAAGGNTKWILWNTSRGFLNKIVAVGQDITEYKQAELLFRENYNTIRQQHTDVLASIRYASRIQKTLLPAPEKIRAAFADSFVFYQPRDVVSGDFYFFHESGSKAILVTVDCTGHGVPGALMTMIANSLLKEIIVKRGICSPREILYILDGELQEALQQESFSANATDGMDVSIGVFDRAAQTLQFGGAFRPALLLRAGEIIELEASRFPIGFYADVPKVFEELTVNTQPGDQVYFFTDGFCDQFGGEAKKKFTRKRFRELLQGMEHMPMSDQLSFISYALRNWQQEEEQTDDILVAGVRL